MLFVEYLITPHYFLRLNINYPKSSYCNITIVNLKKAFVICLPNIFSYISMKIDNETQVEIVIANDFTFYKNPYSFIVLG